MYGTVTIGKKRVAMLANAATPIRYKQLFKKDLLRILIKNSEMDDKRRKLLDEKVKEFREAHSPEEAKSLISERKKQIDEDIRRQEELTGVSKDVDEVGRYSLAVDSLAQELLTDEEAERFEDAVYESYEVTQKLAYIMAAQAAAEKPSDMSRISEETFFKWLEQFEPHEIEAASEEIMDIYQGNVAKDPEVNPKKEDASSTETTTQPSTF